MVVIFKVLVYDVAELLDARQYEVVEALVLYGLYERLHVAVQFGRPRRQFLYPASRPVDELVEAPLEERVVVVDEIFHPVKPPVESIGLVPGNLRHPVPVRLRRDAPAPDLPRGYVLEHEDMHPLEAFGRQYLVGEEVSRGQHVLVGVEESLPVVRPRPVRRVDAVLRHDASDRADADLVAKVHEVVGDAVVAPGGVLSGDFQDEVHNLLRRPWTPRPLGVVRRAVVLVGDEAAIPVHQRVGHPRVLDHLKKVRVEDAGAGGEPAPVLVVQRNLLLPRGLLELLGHDVELLEEVVDCPLHVGDALPGRVVAKTPHEGADFAVEFFLLHICEAMMALCLEVSCDALMFTHNVMRESVHRY